MQAILNILASTAAPTEYRQASDLQPIYVRWIVEQVRHRSDHVVLHASRQLIRTILSVFESLVNISCVGRTDGLGPPAFHGAIVIR